MTASLLQTAAAAAALLALCWSIIVEVVLSLALSRLFRARFVAITSLLSHGIAKLDTYLHQLERPGVFLAMGSYGTQWRPGGPVRDQSVWSVP